MNRITRRALRVAFLAVVSFAFLSSTIASAAENSKRQEKLNGGYYLLHKLADDESQLPILLDFKHSPPEIQTFADQISKLGKETEGAIEQMQEHDSAINYDKNPLPAIEQETRDSISGDKQHQLLFGSHDAEFVRVFLVAQIEASTYGYNLSKVLADSETGQGRIQKLRQLSDKWLKMREESHRILRNY